MKGLEDSASHKKDEIIAKRSNQGSIDSKFDNQPEIVVRTLKRKTTKV